MKKKSLKGFTLIEILIVLTIFSVVALSLYSTFFSGTSVWRRSEDLNRIYQEARWSLDTIANELRNAVILDYSNIYPDFVVFEGGSDKISFLGITDDGIKKISYFLENENSGHVLKRREIAFIDSLLGLESEKSTEVFSDLACEGGLKFSYAYGSNDSGEDISWQDNWQDSQSLPKGVKIKLVLHNPRNPDVKITFNKTIFVPTGIILEPTGEK